jgi:hypothetical protein
MPDLTITAIRTTLLRVPWPQTPWLTGHAFGDARNLLVLDVETKGGIVGMGCLFSFRPGLRTVAMALRRRSCRASSARTRPRSRGIWSDLWRAPQPATAAASSR